MKITKFLSSIILFGLFVLPFIPLFVSTSMFFPFITGKNFAFRIIVEIVFVLWIVLALFDKTYRPKLSWLFYSVMALIGVTTLATIFGVNPYQSFWSNYERMEGLVTLLHLGALFTVLISVFKNELIWRKYFYTSLVSNALVLAYGIGQLMGVAQIHQGGVRLDASLGNAAYLATYCLFHIFLACYFLFKNKSGWTRWLLGFSIVANLFILYFTATRGAILGLIGGILIASLLASWRYRKESRVKKVAVSFLVGLFIFVGLFWLFRNSSFVQSSPVLSRFASISLTEVTTQSRFLIWEMAWQGFKERPILGWGPGNFGYVFSKYYDPMMWRQEPWFDRAHNLIFDWLIDAGLVGFLAYFSVLIVTGYYLLRKIFSKFKTDSIGFEKKNNKIVSEIVNMDEVGAVVLLGLLAAYVFQNLFVFDNIISYWLFFSILAFVHCRYSEEREFNNFQEPVKKKKGEKNKLTSFAQVGTSLLLVGLIACLYYLNVKPINASRNLIKAIYSQSKGEIENSLEYYKKVFEAGTFGVGEAREQLLTTTISVLSGSSSASLKNEFSKLALAEWEKQFDHFGEDSRSRLYYGAFLSNVGMFEEAQKHLLKAKELSPKKQMIIFELAMMYLRMDKLDLAMVQLKEAFDLEPNYVEARRMYALGAILSGDNKLATELISPIKDSEDYFLDNRFLQFYAQVNNQIALQDILEKRINFYHQKIEKEPKVGRNYFDLARAQASLGRMTLAKESIAKAVEVDASLTKEAQELAQTLGIQI